MGPSYGTFRGVGLNPPANMRRNSSNESRFRGHRRGSYVETDIDQLVELRARQRTFDGAYQRTALGNFSYALVILKVFQREFARIGLLYVILAVLLLLISLRRAKRSDEDFADAHRPTTFAVIQQQINADGEPGPRIWGRPFRTSGDAVLLVGVVGTVLYAGLFVLVIELY